MAINPSSLWNGQAILFYSLSVYLWRPFYSLRARAGLLCGCPQGRRRMLSASLLCGCPQGKAREEEPEQAAYGNGERDKK